MLGLFITSLWLPIAFQNLISEKVGAVRRAMCLFLCVMVMYISGVIFTSYSEVVLVFDLVIMAIVLYKGMRCSKRELLFIPFSYIMIAFLNNIIGHGLVSVIEKLFGISAERLNSEPYVWYTEAIITILVFVVSYLIRKLLQYAMPLFENRYQKVVIVLVGGNILLCTIIFLINNWAARVNEFPEVVASTNLLVFSIYTILLFVVTVIVLKIFKNKEQMEQERQQYAALEEYSNQIENMYTNLRAFKHDYINILTSMSGYFDTENYEGLKQYFNENILTTSETLNRDNYRLNQLKNIKDLALKGLVSSKLIYAHEMGIDVYIDILEPIETIAIKEIDLTRILGIYLDNATEAALETEEKAIKFNMVKGENSTAIVLMNSFNDRGIPLGQLEKSGYSTKGDNRGLGLYNVKKILSNYENVYKTTSIDGRYFVQTLEIQSR